MSMICDLCIFAMLAANVVVFVSEPSNTDLAVNALTQFRCSAYVSTLYPDFTLSWVNMDTDTVPAEGDGFSFYSETLEAGGILLVTSILTFSGSANPASYSLACVANVLTVTIPKPFTLSVVPETGKPLTTHTHTIQKFLM